MKILAKRDRVIVEKVNFIKKHQKPDAKARAASWKKRVHPHFQRDVLLRKCNTGVKIGHKVLDDGKKVRTCRDCNEIIEA